MSRPSLADLIARQRAMDDLFILYSAPRMMQGNLKALSEMALVANRLDVLIKRERAANLRSMRMSS